MIRYIAIALAMYLLALPVLAADEAGPAEPNQPTESKPQEIPDVNTIVNKANLVAYYQGDDGKAKVKMTIMNEQGQKREREFIILRKDVKDGGDQKYFVYFQRPADVLRMTYMVHKHVAPDKDDDRWLYLPDLGLVRRIAAGDKRTSFVGSHFLYEDISGRSLEEDKHEMIDVTDKFFLVKNIPKKPDTVEFSYYNVSIDRSTYMPVKIEYFDKNNKLYRTIEAKKIEKIQGFPTPVRSEVSDTKVGGKTIMEYSDVKYNIGLEDIFEERYLRRPPREAIR